MKDTFYITSAIYYVNDVPHVGHTYEIVACDFIARYHRLRGENVFFLTGSDEHSQNVVKAAAERGLTPQAWTDQVVPKWQEVWRALRISNDDWIRTSEQRHVERVQRFVQVLYDRGDGMGAMPAAQMAELAGHPRVAILLGGVAAWSGELQVGQVELHPVKTSFEPRFDAIPTRDELAGRLEDSALMILDVRSDEEFRGKHGYPCDPRQGRIPGARNVPVQELFAGPGEPLAADQIRALSLIHI